MIPGLEVINLEANLRLKIKRNDWLLRKQPIIALYCELENELKFYNLEAWSLPFFLLWDWRTPLGKCCVLEQDTLSSFRPGRQENVTTWLNNCWQHRPKQPNKHLKIIKQIFQISSESSYLLLHLHQSAGQKYSAMDRTIPQCCLLTILKLKCWYLNRLKYK